MMVESGFPVTDGGEDEGAALAHGVASSNTSWGPAALRLWFLQRLRVAPAQSTCVLEPRELIAACELCKSQELAPQAGELCAAGTRDQLHAAGTGGEQLCSVVTASCHTCAWAPACHSCKAKNANSSLAAFCLVSESLRKGFFFFGLCSVLAGFVFWLLLYS